MGLDIASLGGLAVLVAAIAGLWYEHSLLARGPILTGVQAVALLLVLWARLTFGWRSFHASASPTEGGLVTRGPYRWVRHPIYLAALLIAWAGVASRGTTVTVLLGIVATAGLAVRIWAEEVLVTARYPEYVDYARRTKRLIPFVF